MRIEEPPPRELLDREGEGIYLLADSAWPGDYDSVHLRAASIFDLRDERGRLGWRAVRTDVAYFEPGDGDEWMPASTGRFPRHWRLNLPRSHRPVLYFYCTPQEDA